MNETINSGTGALLGAIFGAIFGFLAFLIGSTLHILLMQSVGADVGSLTEFFGRSGHSHGAALALGTAISAALFGQSQGRKRGGLKGGLIGGFTGALIPVGVALMVVIWFV